MNDYTIMIGIGCFFAGLLIAYWVKGRSMTQKIKAAESEAARFTEDAEKKAETSVFNSTSATVSSSTFATTARWW